MKSLTKILFATAILFSVNNTFAKPHTIVKNSTYYDTQDRHLSGFNALSLSGSYDIYITQGSTESVKVEAPADVIDRIVTEVQNGVLKVYNKRDNNWGNWWGGNKKVVVYITAKTLNSITLSGSGNVYFKEGITANELTLHVSGSGDITGKVNVKALNSSVSGSGNVKLIGRADNSNVHVSGSGDYEGRGLTTTSTAVMVSGSGDAKVNASDKIDASVSGSGDITYTGSATHISTSKRGSGDIHKN
jgi:hypothetical protein